MSTTRLTLSPSYTVSRNPPLNCLFRSARTWSTSNLVTISRARSFYINPLPPSHNPSSPSLDPNRAGTGIPVVTRHRWVAFISFLTYAPALRPSLAICNLQPLPKRASQATSRKTHFAKMPSKKQVINTIFYESWHFYWLTPKSIVNCT
jgi:hypothetical protein